MCLQCRGQNQGQYESRGCRLWILDKSALEIPLWHTMSFPVSTKGRLCLQPRVPWKMIQNQQAEYRIQGNIFSDQRQDQTSEKPAVGCERWVLPPVGPVPSKVLQEAVQITEECVPPTTKGRRRSLLGVTIGISSLSHRNNHIMDMSCRKPSVGTA